MKRLGLFLHDPVEPEGFTLVEVMLAVGILAIGILAVASMQIGATNANSSAYRLTERTALAEARVEFLLSLPYGHPDLASGNHADPLPPPGYAIVWTVRDNFPVLNSKLITVTATGQGRAGAARPLTMRIVKSSI
ncbi:MAG: prepilin-type N-terminal cleavage/methylation domain-containing protein [Desulfobacteraceae bacterium]|nr:MAG: prepilin-type N-terminal cleavage/methylation domain-containing protein [Desulfobacteraceae bacterium]